MTLGTWCEAYVGLVYALERRFKGTAVQHATVLVIRKRARLDAFRSFRCSPFLVVKSSFVAVDPFLQELEFCGM